MQSVQIKPNRSDIPILLEIDSVRFERASFALDFRPRIVSEPSRFSVTRAKDLPADPTVSIPERPPPFPPPSPHICWRLLGVCLNFVRNFVARRTSYEHKRSRVSRESPDDAKLAGKKK